MRRLAVPILVLVALGLVVLLWRAVGHTSAKREDDTGTKPARESVESAASSITDLDALSIDASTTRLDGPVARSEDRIDATDAWTFEVEVVWRSTSAPVANAEVVVATTATRKAHYLRKRSADFWDTLGESLPSGVARARTNERGIAVLPILASDVSIRARHDGGAAEGYIQPTVGRRERIELELERFVLARVVDLERRPVERVPVRFSWVDPVSESLRDGSFAESGADGIARVRVPAERPPGGVTEIGLRLAIVARAKKLHPVDLDRLPSDPVELVLPACGSVRARTTHAGKAVEFTTLRLAIGDKDPSYAGVDGDERGDEWAEWRFVEAGLDASIHAWVRSFQPVSRAVRTPMVAGERVEEVIELTQRLPIVRGRCVDDVGTAIGGAEIRARVQKTLGEARKEFGLDFVTEKDGSFSIPIDLSNQAPQAIAIVLEALGPQAWAGRGASASIALPLPPVTELGALVLVPRPVILDGTVVDDAGAPLADAVVLVLPSRSNSRAQESVAATKARVLHLRTDADGRFAAFGDPWPHPARVEVQRAGFGRVRELEFDPGARDVRIVMTRAGWVDGEVLLDERMQHHWFRIALVAPADPTNEGKERHFDAKFTGERRFEARDIAPGTYTLLVEIYDKSVLARVPNVVVVPGARTTVPRIDLRGAVHCFELTVTDPDDKPLGSGTCVLVDRGTPKPQRISVNGGSALLFPKAVPFSIAVGAQGMKTRRVLDVTGDVRVQLERGPRARIVLDPAFRVSAGVELRASVVHLPDDTQPSLYKKGRAESDEGWRDLPLGREGDIELQLSEPGDHGVIWSVRDERDATRRAPVTGTSSFRAEDTSAEQRFVLAPNADDVANAIGQLGQPR